MVISLMKWYHCLLAHPGCKQSRMTIQARYYHPDIWKHVNNFHCDFCQCVEIPPKGMGLLPEHNLTNTPLYEVAINLIGLWTAKTDHFNGEFYALTCIDTSTNLNELSFIDTKSSDAIVRKLRKPGLLDTHDRHQLSTTTAANSQGIPLPASSVFWGSKMFQQPVRIHSQMLYVNTCIRQGSNVKTFLLSSPPQMPQDILHLVDDKLATTMHLMRSTLSKILKANLGALVFSYDMLLNFPVIAEWQTITCNREALVNDALLKNNQQHINYDYYVGQYILKYDNTIKRILAI